jgi:hypothetical protein
MFSSYQLVSSVILEMSDIIIELPIYQEQGDQIGRIFAYLPIVYFWQVFEK